MRNSIFSVVVFLLFAGCSAKPSGETTARNTSRNLVVESLISGERGPEGAQVVVASSASGLSAATGVEVPTAGKGVYVLAGAGQRPTGGYAVGVESARKVGDRVSIRISVREPGPDQMVPQTLTYPYTVAVIQDLTPEGLDYAVEDSGGDPLRWPVVR